MRLKGIAMKAGHLFTVVILIIQTFYDITCCNRRQSFWIYRRSAYRLSEEKWRENTGIKFFSGKPVGYYTMRKNIVFNLIRIQSLCEYSRSIDSTLVNNLFKPRYC